MFPAGKIKIREWAGLEVMPDVLQSKDVGIFWYLNPRRVSTASPLSLPPSLLQLPVNSFLKSTMLTKQRSQGKRFGEGKEVEGGQFILFPKSEAATIKKSLGAAQLPLPLSPTPWGSSMSPAHLPQPLPLQEKVWDITLVLSPVWTAAQIRTAMLSSSPPSPK